MNTLPNTSIPILNLTGEEVTLCGTGINKDIYRIIPPSKDNNLHLKYVMREVDGTGCGHTSNSSIEFVVPTYKKQIIGVGGLPEYVEGRIILVPERVAELLPERTDVFTITPYGNEWDGIVALVRFE